MSDKNKELQKEVEEMDAAFSELDAMVSNAATNAPSTNPPGTAAPATEVVATEAPGTEPPGTTAPATEAPATEVPDEEDPKIASLRAEIEELKGKIGKPKTDAPGTTAPSTDAPLEEHDFLGDVDPYDLVRDKDEFNKLLNKVYGMGVLDSRRLTRDEISRVPKTVADELKVQETLAEATKKFYEDNEDLQPFKGAVATVYKELATANKDADLPELLEKVATETRTRLGIKKTESKEGDNKGTKPTLPRKKGGHARHGSPATPQGVESEIADMDKALET